MVNDVGNEYTFFKSQIPNPKSQVNYPDLPIRAFGELKN
jgi:hypothetical protein